MHRFNAALQELNGDVLRKLLRTLDMSVSGLTRKEQFVAAIERYVVAHLPEIVAKLSSVERLYLAEAVHQGRLLGNREFAARHNLAAPLWNRSYGYRDQTASLLLLFLHHPRRGAFEEPGVLDCWRGPLRGLLAEPQPARPCPTAALPPAYRFKHRYRDEEEEQPLRVYESERIAPRELPRVLRLIQSAKVKVTASGKRPTDAAVRLLGEVLLAPVLALDPPASRRKEGAEAAGAVRAHAWGVLVQQCGWAKTRGDALALTAAGQALAQRFDPGAFREGVQRFTSNDDFDELNRINHIRGQTGRGSRCVSEPGLRKEAITSAMAAFPVGEWLAFDEARRLVDASGESWDVLCTDRPGLYFGEFQYGFIAETAGLNRQYLRAFFMESLATLGIVDLGYVHPHHLWPEFGDWWGIDDLSFCGRYDGLLYVRLNALGAYGLELTDSYEVEIGPQPKLFQVLPNLEIVLAAPLADPADGLLLGALAAPQSDLVWRLDAERILTHVENGGNLEELKRFLLDHNAAEPLPETVAAFLADLERKLGACRAARPAFLLEWADPALSHLLATSPGTNKLCHHAGENRLVLAKDDLAAFRRAAKRLGYVVPLQS